MSKATKIAKLSAKRVGVRHREKSVTAETPVSDDILISDFPARPCSSSQCGRFLHDMFLHQDTLEFNNVKIRIVNIYKNEVTFCLENSDKDFNGFISKKGVPIKVDYDREVHNGLASEKVEKIVVKYLGDIAQVLKHVKNREMLANHQIDAKAVFLH